MISRAKAKYPEYPEGSYYVGQGAYTLEVLDISTSSRNHMGKNHPVGSLNHSPRTRRRYLNWNLAKHKTNQEL
eukprot:9896179-Prorocentrum_lima.AAC.1